jgi:hypothetical protein
MQKSNKTLVSLIAVFLLFGVGCSTIAPGNDPIVVRAEQTVKAAVTVIDSFLKFEYDNRMVLATSRPEIKLFADKLRLEAPSAIREARVLTKTYKNGKTIQNQLVLDNSLNKLIQIQANINSFGVLVP